MKSSKLVGGWRPRMGVVVVGAVALGVSVLAAPRGADEAVRGTVKDGTDLTRLVTGDPAQINAVVAGTPPTATVRITPILRKSCSGAATTPHRACTLEADCVGDPGAAPLCKNRYAVVGQELSANSGDFRSWYEVQVVDWDTDVNGGDGTPAAKMIQVGLNSLGYFDADTDGDGLLTNDSNPSSDPPVADVDDPDLFPPPKTGPDKLVCLLGNNAVCKTAYGDAFAECEIPPKHCDGGPMANEVCTDDAICTDDPGCPAGDCTCITGVNGKCTAGYATKTASRRPDGWCAPGGCSAASGSTGSLNFVWVNIYETGSRPDYDKTCVGGDNNLMGCKVDADCPGDPAAGTCTGPGYPATYAGTLILQVPPGARGKYTVNLDTDATWMTDTGAVAILLLHEDIPFTVNIVTGQCCYGLGTAGAGCTGPVLRSECVASVETPAPLLFTPGKTCKDDCVECATDENCNDNDACTTETCNTDLGICVRGFIDGFNPVKGPPPNVDTGNCCNSATGNLTNKDDGDDCTADSCSAADNRGQAVHPPAVAPCNDGNPCTVSDTCDGVNSEANGGCTGDDVNDIECATDAQCPLDPLGVRYACSTADPASSKGFYCFCTLTPKVTFVLSESIGKPKGGKTCVDPDTGVSCNVGCAKDDDCPGLCVCDLFYEGTNCYNSGDDGEKVTATVHIGSAGAPINGGQLQIEYDPSCLDYNSVVCLAPYVTTVYGPIVDEAAGKIFIACGVNAFAGVDGPLGNTDMLSLSFTKIGECNNCLLCFGDKNPQTSYLVDDEGQKVAIEPQCKELAAKGDLVLVVPDNVTVNSDCDGPTAVVQWSDPTASFSCGTATLTCRGAHESGLAWGLTTCEGGLRNGLPCGTLGCPGGTCVNKVMNGGEFPQGFSSFCCYATADDKCDQAVGCPGSAHDCGYQTGKPEGCWTVEVTDQTSLDIHVELEPPLAAIGELQRCIKFCLFGNCAEKPICLEETVSFGGMFNYIGKVRDTVKIPKGKWACITAQDQLHTLRSCDNDLNCIGGQLEAKFKGDPQLGGNWLIGGNLDGWKKETRLTCSGSPLNYPCLVDTDCPAGQTCVDDVDNPNGASLDVIDILDFGTFVSLFSGPCVDPADTPCGTAGPNADIDGDGCVDMADYNFILRNFMVSAKDCCCGPQAADLPPALAEVTVEELRQMGQGDLAVADLNGDGVLNADDMDAFMQGARPAKSNDRKGGKGLRSGR